MKPMIGGGYLVHEKLKVAFMNFKFTYPCKIESNKTSNMITMMAVVKKTVQIHIIFKLSTEDNITIVDEFVTFKSLLPVSLIMEGVFKKQHKKLFQNIENK
ncbi:MAG TPA: hypothetical protein PK323_12540 [Bacteroidia bacterium]|nr:hypothetical protein [Bacteroidia bacterium]